MEEDRYLYLDREQVMPYMEKINEITEDPESYDEIAYQFSSYVLIRSKEIINNSKKRHLFKHKNPIDNKYIVLKSVMDHLVELTGINYNDEEQVTLKVAK